MITSPIPDAQGIVVNVNALVGAVRLAGGDRCERVLRVHGARGQRPGLPGLSRSLVGTRCRDVVLPV